MTAGPIYSKIIYNNKLHKRKLPYLVGHRMSTRKCPPVSLLPTALRLPAFSPYVIVILWHSQEQA